MEAVKNIGAVVVVVALNMLVVNKTGGGSPMIMSVLINSRGVIVVGGSSRSPRAMCFFTCSSVCEGGCAWAMCSMSILTTTSSTSALS